MVCSPEQIIPLWSFADSLSWTWRRRRLTGVFWRRYSFASSINLCSMMPPPMEPSFCPAASITRKKPCRPGLLPLLSTTCNSNTGIPRSRPARAKRHNCSCLAGNMPGLFLVEAHQRLFGGERGVEGQVGVWVEGMDRVAEGEVSADAVHEGWF